MRRAEFLIVLSFWIMDGKMLGNQMGAAYMKRDRIRDLQVIGMVSFCLPQLVPVKALRKVMRGKARVTIYIIYKINLSTKFFELFADQLISVTCFGFLYW